MYTTTSTSIAILKAYVYLRNVICCLFDDETLMNVMFI